MLTSRNLLLKPGGFHFWLEDPRGRDCIIAGRQSLEQNDPDREDSVFVRVFGDGEITFQAEFFEAPPGEVFLHGDLGETLPRTGRPPEPESGGRSRFEFFPFESRGGGKFSLTLRLPVGGYFSFRLAARTGEGVLAWEPWPYHKLMIDPPQLRCLKLYTLIPTISGTLRDWRRDLDRIKDLGFNAVHILPFTEMGPSQSPYSAANLFAIDPDYLEGPDDLENFVRRAEELGLALCFDIVLNHVSTSSFLAESKAHWLTPDFNRPDGLRRAGAWHMDNWISWEDLVLINYDHPDPQTRKELFDYMKDYLMYWGGIAQRTGGFIRLDNLHSSHRGFIYWILEEMRREAPGIGILSEFFGANDTLRRGVGRWGLNLLMANTWEYPFVPQFRDYLAHVHASSHSIRYLLEPTSHDTPAVAELFASPDSAVPRYFCCALMGTGQTGIVQGYELGCPRKINFIGRQGRVVLEGLRDLGGFIRQVNRLLEAYPVFQGYDNIQFLNSEHESLLGALRFSPPRKSSAPGAPVDGEQAGAFLLLANFDINGSCEYSRLKSGDAEPLLLEGAEILSQDGILKVRLSACGVAAIRLFPQG